MKSFVSILLIITCLISCNENNGQMINNQIFIIETKLFDSIYYHQLNKAYKDNDTSMMRKFFEIWHDSSVNKSNIVNQTSIELQKIFNEVYNPFELQKYGWSPRQHFSKYNYVVLPSEIKFKIVKNLGSYKSLNNLDFQKLDLNTLKPFFAIPGLGKAKIIYDIEPFKTSMQLFLNEYGFQKIFYFDTTNFLMNPISFDGKSYLTPPKILGVLLNEQMDSSIVDQRLMSTGIRITLRKERGNWKMKEVKELWIE